MNVTDYISPPGQEVEPAVLARLRRGLRTLGSEKSGNYGHAGRKGEVGGSGPGGESAPVKEEASRLNAQILTSIDKIVETETGKHSSVRWPGGHEDDLEEADFETRSAVKEHVAKTLTGALLDRVPNDKRAEMAPQILSGVQTRLDTWADTSGDSNHDAVRMQRSVAKEFGLEDAPTEHMVLRIKETEDAEASAFDQSFSRAEYEATQRWFKEQGLTHVTLYRGMQSGGPQFDGQATLTMQPASSWSVREDLAEEYAFGSPQAVVLSVRVPVQRVLSTALTGRGGLVEGEVVLLGGKMRVNARHLVWGKG